MTPVRLEPTALRSRVKHSTTALPHFTIKKKCLPGAIPQEGNGGPETFTLIRSPGLEAIKLFHYSTHLIMKFILVITAKMPTIESLKSKENQCFFSI